MFLLRECDVPRYTDAIRLVNDQLGKTASTDQQLAFVDCGDVLLPGGKVCLFIF